MKDVTTRWYSDFDLFILVRIVEVRLLVNL